jgi:CMP-2-keto-3-deoxyoctulosonic acid synthetase
MNVLPVEDVGIGVDTPEDILKVEKILECGVKSGA